MLRLSYSLPDDDFRTVAVLGDAQGLWDLWWRLTNASPENPRNRATKIKVTTLCGLELQPEGGIDKLTAHDTPLSNL
jgi:hypothetical protein